MTIDVDNRIVVVGETITNNMPAVNGWILNYSSQVDGFATRFSADGKKLDFLTYFEARMTTTCTCRSRTEQQQRDYYHGKTISNNFPINQSNSTAYQKHSAACLMHSSSSSKLPEQIMTVTYLGGAEMMPLTL